MCFVFSTVLSIVVWDTGDQRDQQVVRKCQLSPFPKSVQEAVTSTVVLPQVRICRSFKQQENTAGISIATFKMNNNFVAASSRWQAQHIELCLKKSYFWNWRLLTQFDIHTCVYEQNVIQMMASSVSPTSAYSVAALDAIYNACDIFFLNGCLTCMCKDIS